MKKINIKLGFIVLCFLIAGLYSSTSSQFFSWIIVIFFSVLTHEAGHALAAQLCGKSTLIELSFLGGTTYFRPEGLKRWQLFLIALSGPLFGFLLFLFSAFMLERTAETSHFYFPFKIASVVNFFWTIFNLLPILPLDGGQLLRIIFEGVFKNKGLLISGISSVVFSLSFAILGFIFGQYFIGSLLFLFAFQNFELIRQARFLSSADKDVDLKQALQEAMFLVESGRMQDALPILIKIQQDAKQGIIFNQALGVHAVLLRIGKDYKGLYELLKDYPKLYESQFAHLMHEAAFYQNDMPLVESLSSEAFQKESTKYVAFHAACACAFLNKQEAAAGWLKTALELGLNPDEIKAHPLLKGYADQVLS